MGRCTMTYIDGQLIRVYASVHFQSFLILVIYQQVIHADPALLRTFTTIITILAIFTTLYFKD